MITSTTSKFCWERIHLEIPASNTKTSKYTTQLVLLVHQKRRVTKHCYDFYSPPLIVFTKRWSDQSPKKKVFFGLWSDRTFVEFHIELYNKKPIVIIQLSHFITGIVFLSRFYSWYCFIVWLFVLFSYSIYRGSLLFSLCYFLLRK